MSERRERVYGAEPMRAAKEKLELVLERVSVCSGRCALHVVSFCCSVRCADLLSSWAM